MRRWVLAIALCGCGGAPPPAAPDNFAMPLKAPEGPGGQCITTADAKRERRANEPAKIGAKQILVKWKDAKRAPATITRTREQACLRAIEARDKLRGGAEFADVVKEYSDEAGAATREGSVGDVARAEVEPAFADAAFELDLNQLSDVVETDYGFHVILRTR